jgi:hypothetical protein
MPVERQLKGPWGGLGIVEKNNLQRGNNERKTIDRERNNISAAFVANSMQDKVTHPDDSICDITSI